MGRKSTVLTMGGKFLKFALFPLMLLMLLLVPTRMVAQTDYDTSVTFSALAANPEGYDNEKFTNLFDGKKKADNFSKWCGKFDSNKGAYVIFKASKAGVPVGYTITTGNDNANSGCGGRNPKSWKLYGNNEGQNGAWTLIDQVSNDTKLKDVNYASYDFPCKGSTSYKYFKWELSAIHSGSTLQVGEFELKLNTCSHKNANGSSALGAVINTVETTCTEHGYTTKECSICHFIVKEYLNDELKKHTLTHHEAKDGVKEHWQCDVCHKYFSDANATQEVNYASLIYKGYAVFDEGTGTLTFKYGTSKPEEAYDLNVKEWEYPGWKSQTKNIQKVVFDASFANARPTICDYWFYDCGKLTDIEGIEYLNTEKVTSMESMFRGCDALTSLDLTNFNTTNVTSMHLMFDGCFALTTIYASDKFVTTNVTSSSNMFWGCKKLKGYDVNKVDHYYAHCGTDGYFTPGCAYAEFDNASGTLTFRYKGVKPAGAYDLNEGTFDPEWLAQKEKIKTVVFDASFASARPTSCYYWFGKCSNLTTIEGIEYLNTENVTNMCYMFGSSALTSLDLTKFNTEKVEDMKYMFYRCSALTTIFASDKFVTSKVRFGYDMFTGCNNLIGAIKYDGNKKDHTYANYETGYFTPEGGFHAYAEFDNATGTLTFSRGLSKPAGAYDLNVGNNTPEWSTQKEDINKVVFDASFANARPTSCYKWFDMCTSLTEIEGIENLNTEKVTNMGSMFSDCHVLNPLDVSNFDTQNVEDMSCMFSNCEGLNSLDLSKFDTQKVTNMNSMFWNSSALTTIYVSDKFVTTKVSSGSEMFKDCTSLKGAIDKYEDSKTDKTYANYKTGYFTKLVGKNGEEMIGAAGETLAAENLILEDGKDFVAYEPFAAKDASYCRDIPKGSTWGTLCLPFEVSLANQNFRAFKLLSADDATETVELEEIETSIAAGTPVIIKMKDGANSLSISEADKAIAKDVQNSETANGNYQLQGIYTQKVFDKDVDNNCYIVKGNKLMNPAKLLENSSTTQVGSKPFRAYMVDKSSAPAAGARMFSIAIGGGTTAIDSLNTIADDKAVYYDLQGNRLNAPQKGINIVKRGGKTMKVIIK